jgi:hypothetical protein
MRAYDFTLRFRLAETGAEPSEFVDALAAADCDDATVGIGRSGYIALDFTREAGTAFDAFTLAVCDEPEQVSMTHRSRKSCHPFVTLGVTNGCN